MRRDVFIVHRVHLPAGGCRDQRGRADNFIGGDKVVGYNYDKAGNRTKAWGETFTYDTRNRLATDGTDSYTWNVVGTFALG